MTDIIRRHVLLNFITFYEDKPDKPDKGLNKQKHVASMSTNKDLFPNKMLRLTVYKHGFLLLDWDNGFEPTRNIYVGTCTFFLCFCCPV